MASLYSDAQITELHVGRTTANRAFANLRERYLARGYKDARAEEHAQHGFSRRLGTLIRAVDLVFDLLPPELDAIPERDTVVDATIAIQSFVLNTFGCLDNLAWIFVYEKGVTKPDGAALDPQSHHKNTARPNSIRVYQYIDVLVSVRGVQWLGLC